MTGRVLLTALVVATAGSVQAGAFHFFEGFDGAFSNAWSPDALAFPEEEQSPSSPGTVISYLGAPNSIIQTFGGQQVLRMTDALAPKTRRGLVTDPVLSGTEGVVEARFNTVTQNSLIIDGLFDLWLINSTDSTKYVHVSPFGSQYSAFRVLTFASSIDGYNYTPYSYRNSTWYRLRITSSGDRLDVGLWSDSGTELVGHTFSHGLSALGTDFRIGIAQWMGTPDGTYTTDCAVDYVQATPEPSSVAALLIGLPFVLRLRRRK